MPTTVNSYIVDNTISFTRGDSFQRNVSVQDCEGNAYTLLATDVMTFAVKTSTMTPGNREFADSVPLIEKQLIIDTVNNCGVLSLEPTDTKPFPFGEYKYDIELIYNGGTVCTIIKNADFVLTPEVH